MVTGGKRHNQPSSNVAEILDLQTGQWQDIGRLKQKRWGHSCAPVWVDPIGKGGNIISGMVTNTSVLSMVVAGGKRIHLSKLT